MLLHTYVWHSRPCHLTEIVPGVVHREREKSKGERGGRKKVMGREREREISVHDKHITT